MKLRVPDYYDEFQCIADKCSDNCCIGGWEIDIDEDTYERYQQMSGETGEKLRSSIIQTEDGDYVSYIKSLVKNILVLYAASFQDIQNIMVL